MPPRPKQIESSGLKFGSCVDELVLALRAEIDKANGDSNEIIKWKQKEVNDMKKKPRSGALFLLRQR